MFLTLKRGHCSDGYITSRHSTRKLTAEAIRTYFLDGDTPVPAPAHSAHRGSEEQIGNAVAIRGPRRGGLPSEVRAPRINYFRSVFFAAEPKDIFASKCHAPTRRLIKLKSTPAPPPPPPPPPPPGHRRHAAERSTSEHAALSAGRSWAPPPSSCQRGARPSHVLRCA